jgi:hypothetical protein
MLNFTKENRRLSKRVSAAKSDFPRIMESLEGRTLMSGTTPVASAIVASDEYYVAAANRRGAQLSTPAGGEVISSPLELENTLVSNFTAPAPAPQGIIAVLIG